MFNGRSLDITDSQTNDCIMRFISDPKEQTAAN